MLSIVSLFAFRWLESPSASMRAAPPGRRTRVWSQSNQGARFTVELPLLRKQSVMLVKTFLGQ